MMIFRVFLFAWMSVIVFCAWAGKQESEASLYRWVQQPAAEQERVVAAENRLTQAQRNPEYMLKHWIELPSSPSSKTTQAHFLSLREAILLALRYNPNIQNAELDRIIQLYQLRLAHYEFELQYALAGSVLIEKTHFQGVGDTLRKNYLGTPEASIKSKSGGQVALTMDNRLSAIGTYNPLLNLSVKQPLLRGFGAVNEMGLLNAQEQEELNKLNLKQSVIDQITQVITIYRALVLSGNNLKNQQKQLDEAKKTYEINQKKIRAGQLEPTANIQASYQIESLGLAAEQAENDFKTTAQDLLQTIGLDPEMNLAVPSDVVLDKLEIPDVGQSVRRALEANAQYAALKVALLADERAYKAAKNQQLWQLDVSANVQTGLITGVDSQSAGVRGIYNGRNRVETAGVTLTIPMNDLNRRNQLIAAKVRLEKSRLSVVAARRALTTTIKNTITTIQSQARRYELAQRQVELAAQSYELEKKKLAAGIASALNVNNTQDQLLDAQMGLISAKIAYLNQISALQRLLGTTLDDWQIKLRYSG